MNYAFVLKWNKMLSSQDNYQEKSSFYSADKVETILKVLSLGAETITEGQFC